jgi:hypothetical protein
MICSTVIEALKGDLHLLLCYCQLTLMMYSYMYRVAFVLQLQTTVVTATTHDMQGQHSRVAMHSLCLVPCL